MSKPTAAQQIARLVTCAATHGIGHWKTHELSKRLCERLVWAECEIERLVAANLDLSAEIVKQGDRISRLVAEVVQLRDEPMEEGEWHRRAMDGYDTAAEIREAEHG